MSLNFEKLTNSEVLVPADFYSEIGRQALEASPKSIEIEQFSNERITHRIERLIDILQAFGEQILPEVVYDSVVLYELTAALDFKTDDQFANQTRQMVCQEYLTNPKLSNEQFDYVTSILGDLDFMDNEANSYRANPNIYNPNQTMTKQRLYEIVQNSYQNQLDQTDWDVRAKSIDLDRMKSILRQVNLESVMIKAAQILDDLHKQTEHSDVELFHKVAEIESFYAPICEIIGFDGFASALRDQAMQLRYEKMGRTDILDRAKELYKAAVDLGPAEAIKLLSQISDDKTNFYFEQVAGRRLNGDDFVNTGNFVVNLADGLDLSQGHYRIKSVGSLADKIYQNPKYHEQLPMDSLAYAFVSKNVADLQRALSIVLGKIKAHNVDLRPSANKKAAVYIQGEKTYVDSIGYFLENDDIDFVKKYSESGSFQAARVTFVLHNQKSQEVGVEIQFLTLADRENSRRGSASHTLYKLSRGANDKSLVEETIAFMQQIHDRKKHLTKEGDKLTINPSSYRRSQIWRQQLD